MGISLIALVALSACTDDVDGDRGTGLTGHRLSFIVSMDGEEAQTRADGSGTTAATRYLNSVELKGRQGGKSVYLQAEETDGFPGDGQPLTRGTQINSATAMNAFAVSIYSDPTGTPDQMYNKKMDLLADMLRDDAYPGGNALYGGKIGVSDNNAYSCFTRNTLTINGMINSVMIIIKTTERSYDVTRIQNNIRYDQHKFAQFATAMTTYYQLRARLQIEY